MKSDMYHRKAGRGRARAMLLVVAGVMIVMGLTVTVLNWQPVHAQGSLSVNISAAYNLVVDSNVSSPSTYAPSVATVIGEFCNNGTADLNDVTGYIGDIASGTPGDYPVRNSGDAAFINQHPTLAADGVYDYAFTHVGGRLGKADATRYMGTLAPNECKVQYWHFSYPQCSLGQAPPCTGTPAWGDSVKPQDDLWLDFDIWGSSRQGSSASQAWTMTMRNEISAMANKIKPNPNGQWFNTNTSIVAPGDVITSNGILYELGNINQGFDNNNDGVPDYNAWLQPIGDPGFDPTCFRLIRTQGHLDVSRSSGLPVLTINFQDQLYFTDLPSNNTGVVGIVRYTFMALDGPCNTALTPYQEVASGFDNEKFNGDYGVGIPPVQSSEPTVVITKNADVTTILPGAGAINYTIDLVNGGSADAGLPLYNMGMVISDTIPPGTVYVAGTAGFSTSFGGTVNILYSTDNGQSWTDVEPAANTVTTLQWWFQDPIPPGGSATVSFSASVPASYTPPGPQPLIDNCADGRFGTGYPFAQSCDSVLVQGNNSIGDYVWQDENGDAIQDAGEPPIPNISVDLYLDMNGDGLLDSGDLYVDTQVTDGSGNYTFTDLPNGDFLAVVDANDADLPFGYSNTTPIVHAVPGLGTTNPTPYLNADFGFGPSLDLTKNLVSSNPALEGQQVVYTIDIENLRPGSGNGQPAACQYFVWADQEEATKTGSGNNNRWTGLNNANAFGAAGPDGVYASTDYSGGSNRIIASTGHNIGNRGGNITGVEAVYQIYYDPGPTNDYLVSSIEFNDAPVTNTTFTTAQLTPFFGAANVGLLNWDVTNSPPAGGWQWSVFPGNLDVILEAQKTSNDDGAVVYLDAMGFIITTDQQCGGPDDTLNPVPLFDIYDADKLQFVSAAPAAASVSSGGTAPYANTGRIDWNNVGPIYAGGTETITVTFQAIANLGAGVTTTITNTATVQNATFLSGRPANDDTDDAVNTMNPTGSIGDRVWNDLNGNGTDDAEPGLPGVTVELRASTTVTINGVAFPAGSVIMTAVTDANGNYLFEGLPGADYTVTVDNTSLPGMTQTGDPDGTLDNATTHTTAGDDYLDADFGYTIPAIIFGNVWQDYNGDGLKAVPGDPDFGAVNVQLFDAGNNLVATVVTDIQGNYLFDSTSHSFGAGDYYVVVDTTTLPNVPAVTWQQTADPDEAPPCTTCDSEKAPFTVALGNIYGSYDFGYTASASPYALSGTVYGDWNVSFNFDGNNPDEGFGGVTVVLYASTGAVVSTTTTAPDGSYTFGNLPPGTYQVQVDESTLPAQYSRTEVTGPVTIISSSVTGVDFGYKPDGNGRIGDFAWNDVNGDGVQDQGEAGLPNIEVYLYSDGDGDGAYTLVRTATTDASGLYSFDNLPPGDYRVIVDSADTDLPQYYMPTTPVSVDKTLAAGEAYLDADFGFVAGGLIGDFIWYDNNSDGGQDAGEAGIPGVEVRLIADSMVTISGVTYNNGDLISTTTTDGSGFYEFPGLPGGTYTYTVQVNIATLPGTVSTTPTGDPDRTFDSVSKSTLTRPGQIDRSMDFGYPPNITLGDFVWIDANGDGVQDPGEPGIPGVVVQLTLQGGGFYTTTTNTSGFYSFGNGVVTPNGTHTISIDTGTLPAGMIPTYDLDGTGTAHTAQAVVTTGSRLDADFGYDYSGAFNLSGYVFYDAGNDGGIFNGSTDTGYGAVPVYLWDLDLGVIVAITSTSTNTNTLGFYQFPDLPNGGNFRASVNGNAPTFNNLSLTVPATQYYQDRTIPGADVTHVDFGFFGPAVDCGDLPDNAYKTFLANEGACHVLAAGPYLGAALPDADVDGQPTADASGDGADEDGAVRNVNTNWIPNATVDITVTVSGSNGYLVFWLDWNNDGDFGDAGETYGYGAIASGANQVQVTVPASYLVGTSVAARFRLYDGAPAQADPTGTVIGGEVEDYYWNFSSPTAVSLQSLDGQAAPPVAVALSLLLLGLLTGAFLVLRRRRSIA